MRARQRMDCSCFDEKGTVAVKGYQGSGWSGKEQRVLAKQTIRGTTELFPACNPHEDELTVRFYKKLLRLPSV